MFSWWRRVKATKHLGSDIAMVVCCSQVYNKDLKQNKQVNKTKTNNKKMTKKIDFENSQLWQRVSVCHE